MLPIPRFQYTAQDVIQLAYKTVPEEYIDAFLYYSDAGLEDKTNILRIYLLGIGEHESGWEAVRSTNKNKNGSYDYGFLMLNEYNIKNPVFMENYAPHGDFIVKDDIELWLITCIKFFKSLFLRYGCNGVYAYNAGERKLIEWDIPDSTYLYKHRVSVCVGEFIEELRILSKENRAREHNRLKREVERSMKALKEKSFFRFGLSIPLYKNTVASNKNTLRLPGEIIYDPRRKYGGPVVYLRRFYLYPNISDADEINNCFSRI
jgi:hypothetical protein